MPKILHFLWFGDRIPDFAFYSINEFSQVNPDFEVMFTHKTPEELEKIKNNPTGRQEYAIRRAMSRIFRNDPNDNHLQEQIRMYGKDMKFIQLLSDMSRLELLNEFGGIYLDCDTFPLQPFPESILKHDFFACMRPPRDFGGQGFVDNFFMGKRLDCLNVYDPGEAADGRFFIQHMRQNAISVKYIENRRRFFEMKLKYGDVSFTKDYIVDHYSENRWKKSPSLIPKTTMDDDLWKK